MANKTIGNAINFENNDQWKQFLAKAGEEVSTGGTLEAMIERAVRTGALHPFAMERAWSSLVARLTAKTPWQLIEYLCRIERLSLREVASDLGVNRAQLIALRQSRTLISKESLAVFCRDFCRSYPEYPRGKLMRLLKRAIHPKRT